MTEIRMPSLGAEMEEGTVLEWYVGPGDRVERGQIVALLDTEKAEIEMESFETGWIDALLVPTGETVPVGTPMATVRSEETEVPTEAHTRTERPSNPTPPLRDQPHDQPHDAPPLAPDHRIRATPLARRIARERGVALERVSGSGPGGAIVEADIMAAGTPRPMPAAPPTDSSTASMTSKDTSTTETTTPPSRPAATAATKTDRASRRRQVIAAAMERSKREIPHYYLATSIELTSTLAWLEKANHERPISKRLLFPALLLKAVANAARRFPQLNGHWTDGAHQPSDAVHVGMVVSLRTGGIVVPTLRDADSRSLDDVMQQLQDVVTRARSGRLRSSELSDATLAITSLGEDGVETIYGVIYPPQVSILGFGAIHSEVRAEGDLLGTRSMLRATLAADHRASDGQEGSRFLMAIARQLTDPENL
jgi:pyruvate dehydrogenase E2 component (dihydrolipoamide acetyltransferase)